MGYTNGTDFAYNFEGKTYRATTQELVDCIRTDAVSNRDLILSEKINTSVSDIGLQMLENYSEKIFLRNRISTNGKKTRLNFIQQYSPKALAKILIEYTDKNSFVDSLLTLLYVPKDMPAIEPWLRDNIDRLITK